MSARTRRRLLALCLLAYPRAVRRRDGDHLAGLAQELAERSGVGREAFSLLCGGLVARAAGIRRWALVGIGAITVTALTAGFVAAQGVAVRVEVQSCSDRECRAVAAWAAGLERTGWRCDQRSSGEDVAWQCTRS